MIPVDGSGEISSALEVARTHFTIAMGDLARIVPGVSTYSPDEAAGHYNELRTSWSTKRGNAHRQLRLPVDVWGQLLSSRTPATPYARLVPPADFFKVNIRELTDSTSPVVESAVNAWLFLSRQVAADLGRSQEADVVEDLALLDERWGKSRWRVRLDPADDFIGARHYDETPSPESQLAYRQLESLHADAAARRALARFLGAVEDEDRRVELTAAAPAILAGLWGCSVRAPRLPEEWKAARDLNDITTIARIEEVADVASARALLLCRNSPAYDAPEAWLRLVSWAFSRAATWPGFRAPDPELHRVLVDRDQPSLDKFWAPEVMYAVSRGRMPTLEPVIQVRRVGSDIDSVLAELDELVGMGEVKQLVRGWIALERHAQAHAEKGVGAEPITRHMVLTGNPGTGKTTFARLMARAYRALGVLSRGTIVEVQRADLVGSYMGETEKRTKAALDKAKGGVLFLDEAYALARGEGSDYGQQVIDQLVGAMENERHDLVVIMAGYSGPMRRFLDANKGLESRLPRKVCFPDLSDQTLVDVFISIASKGGYRTDRTVNPALLEYFARLDRGEGFGNARESRNLFDRARENLAQRIGSGTGDDAVDQFVGQDIPKPVGPASVDEERLQQSLDRVSELVGLAKMKEAIQSFVSESRVQLALQAHGANVEPLSAPHMVFSGPPGTGKTTVALMIGELLVSLGLLRSGHVVSTNRAGLVASYIGQTAPLVREKVREAMGGVLFVDEAYALAVSGKHWDFGDEAVTTLLEEMEKNRGKFVVVLAGYADPMERLLLSNQGLRSRVGLSIPFESYSLTELEEIANRTAESRPFRLTLGPGVARKLADSAFAMRDEPGYANARTVRTLLEQSKRNHAQRIAPLLSESPDVAVLSTVLVRDVPSVRHDEPEQFGQYL